VFPCPCLQVVRHRGYLDPKRHYKTAREDRAAKLPKYFAFGTVQEAPSERFSARLTNAERQPSLVAALLADDAFQRYAKKNMAEVHAKGRSGKQRAGAKGKHGGKGWQPMGKKKRG
jgi:hypothetical protein